MLTKKYRQIEIKDMYKIRAYATGTAVKVRSWALALILEDTTLNHKDKHGKYHKS
jgi:hypothetical protein